MKKPKNNVEDWPDFRTLKFTLSVHYPVHLEKLDFKFRQLFEFGSKSAVQSRSTVAATIKYFANEISQQVEKGKHRKQFKFLDEYVHLMKPMKVIPTSNDLETWISMEDLK